MKPERTLLILLILFATAGPLMAGPAEPVVYDLRQGRRVALPELAPELRQSKIVIIGEHHTDDGHHRAQLSLQFVRGRVGIAVQLHTAQRLQPGGTQLLRPRPRVLHGIELDHALRRWHMVGAHDLDLGAHQSGYFLLQGHSQFLNQSIIRFFSLPEF